jgi:hypothetical protein
LTSRAAWAGSLGSGTPAGFSFDIVFLGDTLLRSPVHEPAPAGPEVILGIRVEYR